MRESARDRAPFARQICASTFPLALCSGISVHNETILKKPFHVGCTKVQVFLEDLFYVDDRNGASARERIGGGIGSARDGLSGGELCPRNRPARHWSSEMTVEWHRQDLFLVHKAEQQEGAPGLNPAQRAVTINLAKGCSRIQESSIVRVELVGVRRNH